MSDKNNDDEIIIPKHLADLRPLFIENRRGELEALEHAFASGNLDQIADLATKVKECGTSFGAARLQEIGAELQAAAARADYEALAAYILMYRDYLALVRVKVAD